MNLRTLLFTPVPTAWVRGCLPKLLARCRTTLPVIQALHRSRTLGMMAAGMSVVAISGSYRAIYPPEAVMRRQSAKIESQLPDLAQQTDEICEVLYRQSVDGNGPTDDNVYFLAIHDGSRLVDPSDAFMQRFAGHKPGVKKRSECYISDDAQGRVPRDKTTGQSGIILKIGYIVWQTNTQVYVSFSDYSSNLGAEGGWFLMKRENGRWKVVYHREDWIS